MLISGQQPIRLSNTTISTQGGPISGGVSHSYLAVVQIVYFRVRTKFCLFNYVISATV